MRQSFLICKFYDDFFYNFLSRPPHTPAIQRNAKKHPLHPFRNSRQAYLYYIYNKLTPLRIRPSPHTIPRHTWSLAASRTEPPHASHSTQAGHPPSKAASPQKPRTRKAANPQKPRNPPSLKAPKASKPKESPKYRQPQNCTKIIVIEITHRILAAKPEFLHRLSTKTTHFRHYVEKIVCFGDTT